MGEKTREALKLQFDRRLRLEFHGARITSDAGLLDCRGMDEALGLTETAPPYLRETRGGRNVQHDLVPLLRQSVYSRLAGYEDTNDAVSRCYSIAWLRELVLALLGWLTNHGAEHYH